jgi:choice-of-anchor A domain-containing protein
VEQTGSVVDFTQTESWVDAYSASLAALPSNGSVTVAEDSVTLAGSDSELNVFDLDGAQLGSGGVTITVPADALALVNVTGSSVASTGGVLDLTGGGCRAEDGTGCYRVLFNFIDATELALEQAGWNGSILAPHARLELSATYIDGQVIVRELNATGNAEFRRYRSSFCHAL